MARDHAGSRPEPDADLKLGAALWRTRAYLLPQLRHFVLYGVLIAFTMLLEVGAVLLVYDLLTNKVLQGEPLTEFQAGLLAVDPERFVAVETLDEAARLVVAAGQASISHLQRRLKIGFSRAGRLVDMMEADGLVSAGTGGKAREVLVGSAYFDQVDRQLR